jgi:hypothetical protein
MIAAVAATFSDLPAVLGLILVMVRRASSKDLSY